MFPGGTAHNLRQAWSDLQPQVGPLSPFHLCPGNNIHVVTVEKYAPKQQFI